MTKDWVDFKAVKQAVSMQMVLEHYNINWLRKNGDELRGHRPIHKSEGERTFPVNLSKGAFNCFSCKARGDILDLVACDGAVQRQGCGAQAAGLVRSRGESATRIACAGERRNAG